MAHGGGAIVNISSTRALQSEPHGEAYAASKGGINSLTHALAVSIDALNVWPVHCGDGCSFHMCFYFFSFFLLQISLGKHHIRVNAIWYAFVLYMIRIFFYY